MTKDAFNILLVEDNSADALLLTISIGSDYNLKTADRLSKAIDCLSKGRYDLIFLDLNLPDSTGIQTVVSVHHHSPVIPIIVLTGQDDDEIANQALKEGAQDFLIKGESDPVQLHRSIRYAIERNRLNVSLQKALDERNELETALSVQKKIMSGWQSGSVTANLAGVGPLHDREPEAFFLFLEQYADLLDYYLDRLNYRRSFSKKEIEMLAHRIGQITGGPRDIIDLHLKVIEIKSKEESPRKVRSYTVDGRLFALELMGFLADYYRMGSFGKTK